MYFRLRLRPSTRDSWESPPESTTRVLRVRCIRIFDRPVGYFRLNENLLMDY